MARDFVDQKTHEESRSIIRWNNIKSFLWSTGMLALGFTAAVFGSIALGRPDFVPYATEINNALGGIGIATAGTAAVVSGFGAVAAFPMSLNSGISDEMKIYEYQASLTGKAVSNEMFKEMEERGMVPARKDGKSWTQYTQDRAAANSQIQRS